MIRPYRPALGRKQRGDHRAFALAWATIRQLVPQAWIDRLVEEAAGRVRQWARDHGEPVYGWSGGKDSIALDVVMQAAGYGECCLVLTRLEYPAFLSWATEWMPDGLTVVDRAHMDLEWLAAHPAYLFPSDSRWFEPVQRRGIRDYLDETGAECFAIGRRARDGNQVGEIGFDKKRRAWVSPLWDWTHEEVMAASAFYGPPLPPIYGWPRGWSVGTGPWPARQWTRSPEHGWQEVRQIDPRVADEAARLFPEASR